MRDQSFRCEMAFGGYGLYGPGNGDGKSWSKTKAVANFVVVGATGCETGGRFIFHDK